MNSASSADEAPVTSEHCSIHTEWAEAAAPEPCIDKGRRIFGLCLVLATAFSQCFLSSTFMFAGYAMPGPNDILTLRFANGLTVELVALGLLYYVLLQNGKKLSDIGFAFRWHDLRDGVKLIVGSSIAYAVAGFFIFRAYQLLVKHPPARPQIAGEGVLSVWVLLLVVVNPFFEELIARAFTISEIRALGGGRALAVAISVGVQTSYHFYQGVPYALTIGVLFLVYSLFYIRSGRIMPVIIAHMWADFAGLILYPLLRGQH